MRGQDLRAARERLGATPQLIARSTGLRTSVVEANGMWEASRLGRPYVPAGR